jgi:hypothetical protein
MNWFQKKLAKFQGDPEFEFETALLESEETTMINDEPKIIKSVEAKLTNQDDANIYLEVYAKDENLNFFKMQVCLSKTNLKPI